MASKGVREVLPSQFLPVPAMAVTIQEIPDSTEMFVDKLLEVPLLKSAVTVVVNVYSNVKGHNTICRAGLTITEEILQKVCEALKPFRKHFNTSGTLNSKLCDWLVTIEQQHPQVMTPADQIISQSRDYCSYLATTTVDVVCDLPASRMCFSAADWLLASLFLVAKFQAKKIILARRGLRKIRRTRESKALKDFASPRRFVSPRKRVTIITKLYHWLNGVDCTLRLETYGGNSDKSMQTDRSPEYKKRKHDELKSDSDEISLSDLSDIVENYVSDDDSMYKPEDEACFTDSIEYKEDSDEIEEIDLVDDELPVERPSGVGRAEEEPEDCGCPDPEADRSNSYTIVADDQQDTMEDEY